MAHEGEKLVSQVERLVRGPKRLRPLVEKVLKASHFGLLIGELLIGDLPVIDVLFVAGVPRM